MTSQDYINIAFEKSDNEPIRFNDLDDAIIGTNQNGFLVYDYNEMIDALIYLGMEEDAATDWIDYNVLPFNAGNGFTVVFT